MLNFLKSKGNEDPLKPLNEKDIQSKLYGRYKIPSSTVGEIKVHVVSPSAKKLQTSPVSTIDHDHISDLPFGSDEGGSYADRSAGTESKSASWAPPATESLSNKRFQNLSAGVVSQDAMKSVREAPRVQILPNPAQDGTSNILNRLLTKQTVITGLIVAGIGLLGYAGTQLFSKISDKQITESSINTNKSISDEALDVVSLESNVTSELDAIERQLPVRQYDDAPRARAQQIKPEAAPIAIRTEKPIKQNATNASQISEPVAAPSTKVYSVQICTYYTEVDAKKLTDELKAQGLPAYYQEFSSRSQASSKVFCVLLGKDKNFTDAQTRLHQFKKLPIAKTFADSYVRRI